MKLLYAHLKGCKRFTLSNITEIEAHFKSRVQVIVGSNGSGKSSFMQELCPIPSVRTDYLPGGKKELHIEHEGHMYIVGSDFGNRTSPHFFSRDGEQLNVSGTTDVQTELVEQHFGITGAIRNLIYAKTPLCMISKAERKNLFLNINPMELGLILDTHKKALGRVKDCKANLQLLYSRKTDLEGKMLPDDILNQHKQTKETLNNQLLTVDKVIYGIDQHINTLRERFSEDLEYQTHCMESNTQLIPSELILLHCKKIQDRIHDFQFIERGDTSRKDELRSKRDSLVMQADEIRRTSQTLSEEINEYHRHLNSATERPISSIEKEISDLDNELSKFHDIPENPIPEHSLERHQRIVDDLKPLLFAFQDASVKMISPDTLSRRFTALEQQHNNLKMQENKLGQLRDSIEEVSREMQQHSQIANIPGGCSFSDCGLRSIFTRRTSSAKERHTKLITEHASLEAKYSADKKIFDAEVEELRPYREADLLNKYRKLISLLADSYFRFDNEESLIDKLRTQPVKIHADFSVYIQRSKLAHEYTKLLEKKKALSIELSAVIKSSGASLEFLQNKLKEKESAVRISLEKLKEIESEISATNEQYNLYLEYSLAIGKIEEFRELYSRGERALLVSKSIQYWKGLQNHFKEIKVSISEDLRTLETLVRTQETLRSTYQSEIITLIDSIEKEKLVYEKIEVALSPTTGISHKSMVRYLNALIHNANYFLSQIWSYKMKLLPVREDEPLTYAFPLETPGKVSPDINQTSDGQTEVLNLAWVLTILLQLKLLNKLPFFADEIGRTFDPVHRVQILTFMGQLLDNKVIEQLFIVNHLALFTDGFPDCDVICLNPDNVPELPKTVNEFVKIS